MEVNKRKDNLVKLLLNKDFDIRLSRINGYGSTFTIIK